MVEVTLAAALPLAVAAPLVGGATSPLLARVHRRLPLFAGLAAMLLAGVVLALAAHRVYDGVPLVHFFSNEKPVNGQVLGITFVADPLGISVALVSTALGLALFSSLLSEFGDLGPRELGGLAGLVQLLLAALIAAALTADIINLFVWFEVAALASYGLTGFLLERPIALEAAFKLLVLTSTGGFLVFIGAAMLYTTRGALNFGQLHQALTGRPDRAVLLAFVLMIGGFAIKAGLVPFHAWLPDAHSPVPGAVSALFSGLMVNIGVIGLVRLSLLVFPLGRGHHVLGLLTGLGLTSAVLGAALALVQDDLKRLLAWDTVSQVGLLVVGFASSRADGVAGATFHLVNHALFKALLFLCAGAVVHATGVTSLAEMGGITRRRPILGIAFTVGVMSIAGVPGFNGYLSLDLLHRSLEHAPALEWTARSAQVITVAALSRAAYLGFYRRRPAEYERFDPPQAGMRISLVGLGAVCVALGVFGHRIITAVAVPSAATLLHPDYYAAVALGKLVPRPAETVEVSYFAAASIVPAVLELAAGLALCWAVIRWPEPPPIRWLRRLHTGSINDYAMFTAVGLLVTGAVLLS